VLGGGNQHTLLHQARGVANAGNMARLRLNGEAVQICAPENNSGVDRSWGKLHIDRDSCVQTNTR
jgi:hypothetical protein